MRIYTSKSAFGHIHLLYICMLARLEPREYMHTHTHIYRTGNPNRNTERQEAQLIPVFEAEDYIRSCMKDPRLIENKLKAGREVSTLICIE